MGLFGLLDFVHDEDLLQTEFHLRGTKLVIDGSGLLRQLYGRNANAARYGGEYEDYRKNCTVFFDNLQQCDITPYVVFDGAWDLDDKKYATYIKRHQTHLNLAKKASEGTPSKSEHQCIVPLLAWNVLQGMVNQRKEVFNITVDFEADKEIVALANGFNCPVLANDNDFFIYPLKKYIPFLYIDWKNVKTEQSLCFLQCSLFSEKDKLCENLGIETDRLPLLATIRGNDYLSTQTLKKIHDIIKIQSRDSGPVVYRHLGRWLAERSTKSDTEVLDEVLCKIPEKERQDVKTKANMSIQTYAMPTKKESYFAVSHFANLPNAPQEGRFESLGLPLDLVQNFRKGNLHSMWINVLRKGKLFCVQQVQDFGQASANDISKEIRKVIYAFLLERTVGTRKILEHDRVPHQSKASKNDIPIPVNFPGGGNIPTISEVYNSEPEKRKALILASLEQTESVLEFEDDQLNMLKLPMAVTRYWYKHAKLKRSPKHIVTRGLLIGFLLYYDDTAMKEIDGKLDKLIEPQKYMVHAFAQWQSCLMYASDLNVLLNYPLPDYSIDRLFNGCKTNQLAAFAIKTDAFQKALEMVHVKSKFIKLWNYVKEGEGDADGEWQTVVKGGRR